MARPISIPELTAGEKQILEQRIRVPTTPQRDSLRAEGLSQKEVARRLQISRPCVNQWSQRIECEGLAGLGDRPRPGRPPSLPAATVQRVIEAASQGPPARTRWSTRTLAAHLGIAQGSVARIWCGQHLKPHLKRTCKLSHDPQFEAKF